MDGEKGRKSESKGKARSSLQKVLCIGKLQPWQSARRWRHDARVSLDLTIQVYAAAGLPVMLTTVNSRDVDIELQVQVCYMLLHFNLRLMNFQTDLSNVRIILNKYFRRPTFQSPAELTFGGNELHDTTSEHTLYQNPSLRTMDVHKYYLLYMALQLNR